MSLFLRGLCVALALLVAGPVVAQEPPRPKKIVLLAGMNDHGPEGNGIHDYSWSARLLKSLLEQSPLKDQLRVEMLLYGDFGNLKTLEDADAIMVISGGRDGHLFQEAPHLASPERVRFFDEQMKRGSGLLTFHFSTFTPNQYSEQILNWTGGYFQWETKGKRDWYSAIKTSDAAVQFATGEAKNHPVLAGIKPFQLREEFYYNLRFAPKDERTQPLLIVPALKGREPDGNVVAWARTRADGGRGFGTSCGHFYDNWKNDDFRKLILNALVWCAKLEVPAGGVPSKYLTHDDLRAHLGDKGGFKIPPPAKEKDKTIKALLLAGNDAHRWHNWEKTTPAIKALLERDSRIQVTVSQDIEDLGRKKLSDYQLIVQNYVNWQDPKGLSEPSRLAFMKFVEDGGGLLVVHFANGAFHASLPKAEAGQWLEYQRLARRAWDHKGKSGHDPFGRFQVNITPLDHPITKGLKSFEIDDELYFQQAGQDPIEPLIMAKSRVTGKDEPLAFAYTVGKGKVFQTFLGHSEKTYDAFAPREMLRRAAAWVANEPQRPLTAEQDPWPAQKASVPPAAKETLVEGKFGKALNASAGFAIAPGRAEYREPPLTIDLWAKLNSKASYNILLASETKASARHWELFTMPGSGHFTVYVPGMAPDHVYSKADIGDGRWHHLTMLYEADRLRLFVDGQGVADQKAAFAKKSPPDWKPQELGFGILAERSIRCAGLVDEVRITRGIVPPGKVPDRAPSEEAATLGLWRFDETKNALVPDAGSLKNAARLETQVTPLPAQGFLPPDGLQSQPVDARLKTVLIDRSSNEVYLSVKADTQGRLFVGGRDSLFVFEADGKGGYLPRKELVRFPPEALITGIEIRGNDLYVLTINALYVIPEGRTRRQGLQPRRLVWGLPVDLHVSFHCLAWGPEGDLYFNHGDPLLNYGGFNPADHWGHWTLYTQPEGTKVPFTGQGAVLRVRSDGSDLRVVAGGLRGPVGITFDRHWNLFTNDNDHESRADLYTPARLLHVTPHVDFAWPRGWTALRDLNRYDLLHIMNSDTARGVPVGLAYYDEGLLPAEYRGQLLHGRWEAQAVTTAPLLPRGASFQTQERPFVTGKNNSRTMAVSVGQGGRVFFSTLYLAGNVGVPHCVSDLLMVVPDKEKTRSGWDVTTLSDEQLWAALSATSGERRGLAHQEILRRGPKILEQVEVQFQQKRADQDPAWSHLLWLAGARGTKDSSLNLVKLANHSQAMMRLQAVRVLAEFPHLEGRAKALTDALGDHDPQVQLAALAGFFSPRDAKVGAPPLPFDPVAALACSGDSYLRQTATRLLAERVTVKELLRLLESPEPARRLAGVLALGHRLTVPPVHGQPAAALPLHYTSGNAHFTLSYADAPQPIDLKKLGRVGSFTMAEAWKATPPSAEQQQLFAGLQQTLGDNAGAVRMQAAYYLSLLNDPRTQAQVAKVLQTGQAGDLVKLPRRAVPRAWVLGPSPHELAGGTLGSGIINLSEKYNTPDGPIAWQEMEASKGRFLPSATKGTAFLLFQLQSPSRQPVLLHGTGPARWWHNGKELGTSRGDGPSTLLVDIQPGSNDLLMETPSIIGGVEISYQARGEVRAALQAKLDSSILVERLKEAARQKGDAVAEVFLNVDWPEAAKTGDHLSGRHLFGKLGCAKCHAISPEQSGAGAPSLADARKRFTVPHLVESILLPSKQVAEPFRSTLIETRQGQVFAGLLVGETGDKVELLQPDATRRIIPRKDIEERRLSLISAMPPGLVRTPAELRDLLAYLLSDHPTPP